MKTKLLKVIRRDKRFIIEHKYYRAGFQHSGWWYLTDTKFHRAVRHKRIKNIVHEYAKLHKKRVKIKWIFRAIMLVILFFVLNALFGCKKQTYSAPVKLPPQYTITASDTAYRYQTDTIYMWKNRTQIHPGSNLVKPGDTIKVYYNPGNHINTLQVWLNGGKFIILQNNCMCITTQTFIIKNQTP